MDLPCLRQTTNGQRKKKKDILAYSLSHLCAKDLHFLSKIYLILIFVGKRVIFRLLLSDRCYANVKIFAIAFALKKRLTSYFCWRDL